MPCGRQSSAWSAGAGADPRQSPKGVTGVLQIMDDSTTTVAEGIRLAGASPCAGPLPASVLALLSPWRLVLDQLLLMAESLCTPSQRETLRRHRAWLKDAPGQSSGDIPLSSPAHDRQGSNSQGKGPL